jgi:uncharacterized protein YbaR (Trm112 family)
MTAYLKKVLNETREDMDGAATTPAAEHLFQIVDGIPLLDDATSGRR